MYNINLLDDKRLIPLLNELNEDIIKLYGENLKDIILFGSYARGDNDDDSDIDIMILLDLDDDEQKRYRRALVEKVTDLSIHYDTIISVIDNNYTEFNRRASYVPFYKNVANEGIKIYAS